MLYMCMYSLPGPILLPIPRNRACAHAYVSRPHTLYHVIGPGPIPINPLYMYMYPCPYHIPCMHKVSRGTDSGLHALYM